MTWLSLPPPHRHELTRRLTQRQLDVYMLWLAGCSYDRIATMLTISPRSVRTHLNRARTIHNTIRRQETPA